MAAVEQIIWTPVPNGLGTSVVVNTSRTDGEQEGGTVQISVRVSPTLSGGATGTLTDFPDFQNWPNTLINAQNNAEQIQLTFTNANRSKSVTVGASFDTSVLNNDLWDALFSPPGNVEYTARDAAEPYTDVPVVSYPSDQVASYLQTNYAALAASSPTDYPSLSELASVYSDLGHVGPDGLDALNSLYSTLAAQRTGSPTTGGTPPYANDWSGATPADIFAAMRFYHMPPSTTTPSPPTLPDVDFHRALTFIGQHRTLQRALGLVLDVTVSTGFLEQTFGDIFDTAPTSNLYVSAVLANDDGVGLSDSSPISPRVQCDAGPGTFQAHASSSQIVGRQLTLADTSSFAIYEVDVDGGGLKTTQFADNLKLAQSPQSHDPNSQNGPAPDAPTAYAPPSLRSAGLTVAAVNRGLSFVARLQRTADLMTGASSSPPAVPDLTAEDLVTGYVLDVYDATYKAWNSTAMRDVTYTAGSTTLSATADEPGLDSPPRPQSSPTQSSQKQLNLPANIIRWTGWSNTAPRPGDPLSYDGSSTVNQNGPGSGPFNQLTIAVTPTSGTLPRLRFGTSYALRARIVDIAGNVIPMSDGAQLGDTSERVTPLSVFGRFEPVGSPDIYSWNAPLPAESLKTLVIRDIDSSPSSVRAFAPNRIAELFAELHGEFDVSSDGETTLSKSAYTTIVDMESQRYPMGSSVSTTSPVPFLPDPLSRGGVLNVTLGPLTGNQYSFDFSPASGQSWPSYQPYGLILAPAGGSSPSQSVTPDSSTRELTFALTPGDTVTAQLSSYIDEDDLQTLGMYDWVSEHYDGTVPAAFTKAALAGLTWVLTPYTTIGLVYAVEKPLLVPKFFNATASKYLGETYATLIGDVSYSPKSTASIAVLAAWREPVDNGPGTGTPEGPGSPDPTPALRESTVFTIPSTLAQENSVAGRFSGRHEFFDLKHRNVFYYGKATSRFTEHYQGSETLKVPSVGTAVPLRLPGKGNLGLEPGSVTVSQGGLVFQEGVGFTIDPTAGTITFAAPHTGPGPGTYVSVDFLPAVSVDSAPFELNILSSGRPQSPAVEFIVPIYAWSEESLGNRRISRRSPSALRVFLNRPWWTSGTGELLGVLTSPTADAGGSGAGSAFSSQEAQYVSDWGLDPVFRSGSLPSPHPRVVDFTARVDARGGLTIPETTAVRVDVAGHTVSYDSLRDLWYADIPVAIGNAYTPMIRLALARFQPNSVTDAELSPVVLADIMSLEPGRSAVVIRDGPNKLSSVTISGSSYGDDADSHVGAPGYAELVVERRSGIHDDVIGWEPVTRAIRMSARTVGATTYWTARNISIPSGGTHRLYLAQYEVLPQDKRPNNEYADLFKHEGLRLVYQDTIPL